MNDIQVYSSFPIHYVLLYKSNALIK